MNGSLASRNQRLAQDVKDMTMNSKERNYRKKVESHIGRKLTQNEHVHHKDGNYMNNDITNLQVMDVAEHRKYHAELKRKKITLYGKHFVKTADRNKRSRPITISFLRAARDKWLDSLSKKIPYFDGKDSSMVHNAVTSFIEYVDKHRNTDDF